MGDKGAVALGAIIAATEQMALHEPLGLAAALQNPITVLGLHRVARMDPGPHRILHGLHLDGLHCRLMLLCSHMDPFEFFGILFSCCNCLRLLS